MHLIKRSDSSLYAVTANLHHHTYLVSKHPKLHVTGWPFSSAKNLPTTHICLNQSCRTRFPARKCRATFACLHVLWQPDGNDLLLHDVLQAQHHPQLALHLLPVGTAFCQVTHRLERHKAIEGHAGTLQRSTARNRCDNTAANRTVLWVCVLKSVYRCTVVWKSCE